MIDIHSHIIPGVDDGASSLEEAIEMIMMAIDQDVNKIILTPHSNQRHRFENYYPKIKEDYKNLVNEVKKLNLDIDLYLGMEIFASEDIVQKIQNKQLIGLNFSQYYLLEFPFHASSNDISSILNQVLELNIIPIIAHPERYDCIINKPETVLFWVKMGCLLQVNQGSLFNYFGKKVKQTAHILLRNKLAHFIASDCHDIEFRIPLTQDIQDLLELTYGMDYTYDLLYWNAKKFLDLT